VEKSLKDQGRKQGGKSLKGEGGGTERWGKKPDHHDEGGQVLTESKPTNTPQSPTVAVTEKNEKWVGSGKGGGVGARGGEVHLRHNIAPQKAWERNRRENEEGGEEKGSLEIVLCHATPWSAKNAANRSRGGGDEKKIRKKGGKRKVEKRDRGAGKLGAGHAACGRHAWAISKGGGRPPRRIEVRKRRGAGQRKKPSEKGGRP